MDTTNWNDESKKARADFFERIYDAHVAWLNLYGGKEEIDREFRDAIAFDKDTAYCRYALARDEKPEGV